MSLAEAGGHLGHGYSITITLFVLPEYTVRKRRLIGSG